MTYIPERFRKAIVLHIIKNYVADFQLAPLLLGIHGPSGYGKTFQTEHILHELRVQSFLVSGGQLESNQAGQPAELLRTTYLEAGRFIDKNKLASVLLINDVDTGLGQWGELVQYTINRQTVFGELMHISDYPTVVENIATRRVPIILTGNDFSKLYEPLVRAGRMSAFEWKPNIEEKAQIVQEMFTDLSYEQCLILIRELQKQNQHGDLPVAFFSHLKHSLNDDILWKRITEVGERQAITYALAGQVPMISKHFEYNEILEYGKSLMKSGQLINHLRR